MNPTWLRFTTARRLLSGGGSLNGCKAKRIGNGVLGSALGVLWKALVVSAVLWKALVVATVLWKALVVTG